MNRSVKELDLPEGKFDAEVISYDDSDKPKLKKLFNDWVKLCKELTDFGSTRIANFPEAISEAIVAIEMNAPRVVGSINGSSSSFDNYDFKSNSRIQLKGGASYGPQSFGPRSEYDKLFLLLMRDIADTKNRKKRVYSGNYEIYEVEPKIVEKTIVNKKENKTVADYQLAGKRPRFVIAKKVIFPNNIKPFITGNIDNW